jgi:hypothetical protein
MLPQSGTPIARATIQPISKTELSTTEVQGLLATYDAIILEKLNASNDSESMFHLYREEKDLNDDNEDGLVEPNAKALEVVNIEADACNEIFLTQPLLMKDGTINHWVKKRYPLLNS